MRKRVLALFSLVVAVAVVLLATRSGRTPPHEVLRGDLDLREGVLYLRGGKQPFEGLLVENFYQGSRKLAIEIRRGKAEGLSRGWFADGQMEVEETLVGGVSQGLRTRWHANGQKKSEEPVEQGVVTGRYVEWHDNGQKAAEMTLKEGHPDGLAEAWHPDGTLKSQTQFESGKIVKQEFFPASQTAARTAPEVVGR